MNHTLFRIESIHHPSARRWDLDVSLPTQLQSPLKKIHFFLVRAEIARQDEKQWREMGGRIRDCAPNKRRQGGPFLWIIAGFLIQEFKRKMTASVELRNAPDFYSVTRIILVGLVEEFRIESCQGSLTMFRAPSRQFVVETPPEPLEKRKRQQKSCLYIDESSSHGITRVDRGSKRLPISMILESWNMHIGIVFID